MFNKIRFGAAGVAIVAAFGMASAANAAVTTSAPAEAEILESLTLTVQPGSTLDFGAIAATGAGTVTVSSAGAASCTGLVTCPAAVTAVGLNVTGNAAAVVAVSFPVATASLSNGTNTMTIGTFTRSAATVTLSGTGTGSFSAGGTLAVGNGQQAGTYTGSFGVRVEYQ